ncbi:MAG: hypothetical protein ACK5Z2_20310 [Bacteroidota bacterium]|jgi:hypothetical protein
MGQKFSIKKPNVNQGKNITAKNETPSFSQFDYPIFCFKHLHQGEFGVERCDTQDQAALLKRLNKLSQMSWQQINTAQRHGLGWEKISQSSVRAGIPRHVTPDVDLLAFRFSGLAPFVGYRNLAVFHILFIDSKFNLYNH